MADLSLKIADFEVSFFGSVTDTAGQVKTLNEVFNLIYTGGSFIQKINQIRELVSQGDNKLANSLKVNLPSVIFSCQTNGKGRSEENIHQLYPLLCLDIDAKDNPNINLIYEAKFKIIQEPSVLACFVSPSGLGLKVIIRTAEEVLTIDELSMTEKRTALHNFRVTNRALVEHFKLNHGLKLDPHSGSPVALNFISYDPNLYLNWEAEPFNTEEFLELERKNYEKTYSKNKEHKAKASETSKASKELDLDGIDLQGKVDRYDDWYKVGFGLADEFGEEGRALFHKISQQSKGYDKYECDRRYDQLLRDSRGELSLGTAKHILGLDFKTKKTKKQEKEHEKEEEKETEESEEQNLEKISLEEYLDKFGFLSLKKGRLYYPFSSTYFKLVAKKYLNLFCCEIGGQLKPLHLKNNKLYILEKLEIEQVIENYINDNIQQEGLIVEDKGKKIKVSRIDLTDSVSHWRSEITSDGNIFKLPTFSLQNNLLRSTPTTAYKFYNNGVLCIDGKTGKTELKSYDFFAKQGKYVFEHEILNRNYIRGDAESSEIARFVENISGTQARTEWCQILLGYLAHNYINGEKKKAVIFSDSQNSGHSAGRTGKGILCEMVRQQYETKPLHAKNSLIGFINGKRLNSESRFNFQACNENTRLIIFDDLKPNYDIEQHFVEMLTGFTVEKKNSHPFTIQAKLILTTNYSVSIEGSSSEDRFLEFSLLPYYSSRLSPAEEFGCEFFSEDWTKSQWANYDAFMHQCILLYFNTLEQHNGNILQLQDEINMIKKLEDLVGEEFLNFADNLVNADGTLGFQEGVRYYRQDLLLAFCNKYPKIKISAKTFLNKVRQYKQYHPDWQEDQLDKDNNRTQEGKDSRGRYIIFIRNNNTNP